MQHEVIYSAVKPTTITLAAAMNHKSGACSLSVGTAGNTLRLNMPLRLQAKPVCRFMLCLLMHTKINRPLSIFQLLSRMSRISPTTRQYDRLSLQLPDLGGCLQPVLRASDVESAYAKPPRLLVLKERQFRFLRLPHPLRKGYHVGSDCSGTDPTSF